MRLRRTPLLAAALVACSLILAARAQPADSAATVVIVVRHAEVDADGSRDPALNEAGRARADALAGSLAAARVRAVYSTGFARTRATAAPAARTAGVDVTVTDVTATSLGTYGADLARRILAEHRGETVLVVGHSNTVPALVEALGGGRVTLGEAEFDRVFVLVVPASGPARVVAARY